jgi:hypothetical protein
MLMGVWVPFAFESVAWKKELYGPGFLTLNENQKQTEPLLLKYPLLRMISRITLGPRYHESKIKLTQDLPALLGLIREHKFIEAEVLLLDLFSIGAFGEKTESVIWLQKTLHETSQTRDILLSNQATLRANQEDESRILEEWRKVIADFRSYLHLAPETDDSSTNDQDACIPLKCQLYDKGPLRGIPIQPELPNSPESLQVFGRWYAGQLSEEERRAVTDEAITKPLQSFKERTSSLTTTFRKTWASQTKLREDLKEGQKILKRNDYLMAKAVGDLIKIASVPPEIFFGDVLI